MALTREQYDSIMLHYSRARARHRREQEQRRAEILRKIPAYRDAERAVSEQGIAALRQAAGSGMRLDADALRQAAEKAREEKRRLLIEAGYPADYLDLVYDCPDCRDTGYIGTEKCHCLRQQEIALLYHQSHVEELARTENFSTLSTRWYTGIDLNRFTAAARAAREFVRLFGKDYHNLYFYGTVGTGKSFLSVCIAHELIEKGHSVLYFSSSSLFEQLSSAAFDRNRTGGLAALQNDICSCDLLIIDDLGTELNSSFVATQLFSLINNRDMGRRATIISSNLSIEELQKRYSDRIFSRIASRYDIYQFSGPDIRYAKRLEQLQT